MLLSLKLWNYKHALILCMPVHYKAVKCSLFVELMTFYYRIRWSIVLFTLNWTKFYRNLITNWQKGSNISVYRELFNLIAVRCCSPLPINGSGNHFLGKKNSERKKRNDVLWIWKEKNQSQDQTRNILKNYKYRSSSVTLLITNKKRA